MVHLRGGCWSNSMEFPDRKVLNECGAHSGGDDEKTVGLAVVGGQFREKFIIRHPGGCGQSGHLADQPLDFPGDFSGGPQVDKWVRDVEMRLVKRKRLNEWREPFEYCTNLP